MAPKKKPSKAFKKIKAGLEDAFTYQELERKYYGLRATVVAVTKQGCPDCTPGSDACVMFDRLVAALRHN